MKVRTTTFVQKKRKGEKITLLTAYDYTSAYWVDRAGIDGIIVGDSLSMVIQGNETTLPVTVDEMIYHTKLVRKAVKRALVISDMPFLSYQTSEEDAIRNCGRMLKEGGAEAVKIEGGEEVEELVRRLVSIGIPVMGHIGLTPQKVHFFGGYKVVGKDEKTIEKLKRDAKLLEKAGVFSIVLENIPMEVARDITEKLKIPTIGIGAGPHCDGQVLVFHDILGLYEGIKPKFVKRYAEVGKVVLEAIRKFKEEVEKGLYPSEEYYHTLEGS